MNGTGMITIERHLEPNALTDALRADAESGLLSTPKDIPPKWFYDDRGSRLFDDITRLDEYYPTRTERAILETRASTIASMTNADTLIELGSGTSDKTRLLLDALEAAGSLRRFVPFDVSEAILTEAAEAIARRYRAVRVHAVVGDFEHHLSKLPTGGARLIAFLGGTIGNLAPSRRAQFLGDLASGLRDGDHLLIGTDLVKDPQRLVAAYDDAAGVTAEFNKNVLHVLNRELDADFAPDDFDHVAVWDPSNEWIEMRLRARRAVDAKVRGLDVCVSFDEGESMRTEISAKFRRDGFERELAAAGLTLVEWWTDPASDFALSLSRRT